MRNIKSTIGGALGAFGVFLFGAPTLLNTMSPDFPKPFAVWCMGLGLLLNGLGIFFGHLFAADAKEVQCLSKKVESNSSEIAETKAVISGDTTKLSAPLRP